MSPVAQQAHYLPNTGIPADYPKGWKSDFHPFLLLFNDAGIYRVSLASRILLRYALNHGSDVCDDAYFSPSAVKSF
jgi:hypothetical protein